MYFIIRVFKWELMVLISIFLLASDALAERQKILPITDVDFPPQNEAKEKLGQFLFFDKILSGNGNISCATCHHALTATGDGLSLPVGEGGRGIGVTRDCGSEEDQITERVPRNAPHLFNIGAREFVRMFHDGRVEINSDSITGFNTPAGNILLPGLDNVLAAQAMFPLTSNTEMAGHPGENEQADSADVGDFIGVWRLVTDRIMAISEYRKLFAEAYPGLRIPEDVTFVHVANAIGAFEAAAYRSDNSPYDRYLRGEMNAMSQSARKGYDLFNGKAQCSNCHSGKFQTDHEFHALGIPQIGPGKGDGFEGKDDFGREKVSLDEGDRYRFRTPTLRNVAITGPWGHDGAFNTLEGVVRHHLDAAYSLNHYDIAQAVLPYCTELVTDDFIVYKDDSSRAKLESHIEVIEMISLTKREFGELMDFLHALTDPNSLDLRETVPSRVPSGASMRE